MRMIYVAGPYRSDTPEGVQLNIKSAQMVGARVASLGWQPVVPHNMSAGLEALGDEYWLDATMELMLRCDGVVLIPGHETSEGTQAEILEALSRDMPVYELEDLPHFGMAEEVAHG